MPSGVRGEERFKKDEWLICLTAIPPQFSPNQPTNQPACLFVYSRRHLLLLLFFPNRGRADAPDSPGAGDGRGPRRGGFSGCGCPHSSVTGSRIAAEEAAAKDSERRASSSSSSGEGEEGGELREVNGVVVVLLSGLVPAWSGCCQDPPPPSAAHPALCVGKPRSFVKAN